MAANGGSKLGWMRFVSLRFAVTPCKLFLQSELGSDTVQGIPSVKGDGPDRSRGVRVEFHFLSQTETDHLSKSSHQP